jgi:hypothetical protein
MMKKYSQGEGSLEILRGDEAVVVNEHLSKTGKAISDFSDEERKALHSDLDKVRGTEESEETSNSEEESD